MGIALHEEEKQSLIFFRKASKATVDANGNIIDRPESVLDTQIGVIQPWGADLILESGSLLENTNKSSFTHIGFVENRLADIRIKDYIRDENGNEYIIQFVHDFKGHPQQFDLIIVEDADQ